MYKEYLIKLFEVLNETKFFEGNNKSFVEYEEGMERVFTFFKHTRNKKKKVFFIGNGGSAAIASHMTIDFMKNGRMKTCSLFNSANLTCFANDCGYDSVFSQQLAFLVEPEDLLIAISSSGNSPNVVKAIEVARERFAKIITFSGFRLNNKIVSMGDYNVYVPVEHYGIVESIHNLILQQIVDHLLKHIEEDSVNGESHILR